MLGADTGIIIVEIAPSMNVPTVIALLPIVSYRKPITKTVGMASA